MIFYLTKSEFILIRIRAVFYIMSEQTHRPTRDPKKKKGKKNNNNNQQQEVGYHHVSHVLKLTTVFLAICLCFVDCVFFHEKSQ